MKTDEFYPTVNLFGDLKAGDRFAYRGGYYEKVSGNYADLLVNEKVVLIEEIPATAWVVYYEAQ